MSAAQPIQQLAAAMPDQPPVAYFLTLFPKLSESFVLNEVVEVERRGVPIVPICFDRSRRLEIKRHAAAEELKAPVHYVSDAFATGHASALAWWLSRRPVKLARLFVRNLRHPAPRGERRLARFVYAAYAGRLVQRSGATHIHAHWSYPGDVAYLLHDLLGVTFSITAHAHDIFEDIALYEQRGFAFARRARSAAFVVACTAYNAQLLRGKTDAVDWPKLTFAYHGLDTQKFRPDNRPEVFAEVPLLISVGRMVPYKGFDVIVRAIDRLHRAGRPVRAKFAGSPGSLTAPVTADIERRGLGGSVEVLGEVTQEELVELYDEADIFVNASNPDGEYGVANVIVESLASGLPTIATHRPHVHEYIEHGVNGFLTHYGDDAELADMISRVLDDAPAARRVARAGRDTACRRFDINATANLLARLLVQASVRAEADVRSSGPPPSSSA